MGAEVSPDTRPADVSRETIRALRSALGLTQAELAALVDSSRPSIARWEVAGCVRPPLVLAAAADAVALDCLPRHAARDRGSRWGWLAELFHRLDCAATGAQPWAARLASAEQRLVALRRALYRRPPELLADLADAWCDLGLSATPAVKLLGELVKSDGLERTGPTGDDLEAAADDLEDARNTWTRETTRARRRLDRLVERLRGAAAAKDG